MAELRAGPRPEDVTVAALFALPFAAYLVVLRAVATPTDAQWAAVDPILTILPRTLSLRLPPLAAVVVAAAWWRFARPDREALRRGALGALFGAVIAGAAAGALRLAVGETLPGFIPKEESAG